MTDNNVTNNMITYQSDFICTYQMMKDETDSLLLYQIQLLQAFNLAKFDDAVINKMTEELYEKYKNNKYIKGLLESDIIENTFDDLTKFRMYFRYDTFHKLHSVLCSLINNSIKKELEPPNLKG
jgi:hypothetical protein